MPRWLNVPNLFTLARVALTPLVVVAIVEGRHLRAASLFSLAAGTDLVDGAVARRFGSATPEGAYLDPIADKLLLSGVYLALAVARLLPWWLVAVVFGRDILILLAAAVALLLTRLRNFPPSRWGKLSTFAQVVTAVMWMARNAFPYQPLEVAAAALIWPTAALTVWSGIHYGWVGIRRLRID